MRNDENANGNSFNKTKTKNAQNDGIVRETEELSRALNQIGFCMRLRVKCCPLNVLAYIVCEKHKQNCTHTGSCIRRQRICCVALSTFSPFFPCCGTNRWIFASLRFILNFFFDVFFSLFYWNSKWTIKFIIEWFNVVKWSVPGFSPGAASLRMHALRILCADRSRRAFCAQKNKWWTMMCELGVCELCELTHWIQNIVLYVKWQLWCNMQYSSSHFLFFFFLLISSFNSDCVAVCWHLSLSLMVRCLLSLWHLYLC